MDNSDIPSAIPVPPIPPPRFDRTTGHIIRPLPKVKTVAEAIAKRAKETGDVAGLEQTPAEAKAKLTQYNDEVLARLKEVNEYFAPKDLGQIDPTKSKDFNVFIRDQLSYVNMRYVTLGRFTKPGAEENEAKIPLEDPRHPLDAVELPEELDPMLKTMNSTRLAVSQGLDLTGQSTEEPA